MDLLYKSSWDKRNYLLIHWNYLNNCKVFGLLKATWFFFYSKESINCKAYFLNGEPLSCNEREMRLKKEVVYFWESWGLKRRRYIWERGERESYVLSMIAYWTSLILQTFLSCTASILSLQSSRWLLMFYVISSHLPPRGGSARNNLSFDMAATPPPSSRRGI